MNTLPTAVKAVMAASGGVAPISLLEVQTISGNRYFWSDSRISMTSIMSIVYALPPTLTIGPTGTPIVSHPYAVQQPILSLDPDAQVVTSTSLSTSETTVATGDSVTFVAVVGSASSGVPTGSVSFYDGSALLGTEALTAGSASLTTAALLGTVSHSITAQYSGDSGFFGGVSAAVLLSAGTLPGPGGSSLTACTVLLSSAVTTILSGLEFNLFASVVSGLGGTPAPTGTITFYDGGTVLGTVALAAAAASLAVALSGSAGHAITAIYSGDSVYASSASVGIVVNTSLPSTVTFLPWIASPPSFHSYGTTQTTTASMSIQNVSGDTVQRDASLVMLRDELTNAIFFYRLYKADCEVDVVRVMGYVADPEIDADGEKLTMNLKGYSNWSEIDAPDSEIGVSCGLQFGSMACGSTSPTPCNNSYGTCTSIERYKGVITEWSGAELNYAQTVQPQPLRLANTKVAS